MTANANPPRPCRDCRTRPAVRGRYCVQCATARADRALLPRAPTFGPAQGDRR